MHPTLHLITNRCLPVHNLPPLDVWQASLEQAKADQKQQRIKALAVMLKAVTGDLQLTEADYQQMAEDAYHDALARHDDNLVQMEQQVRR